MTFKQQKCIIIKYKQNIIILIWSMCVELLCFAYAMRCNAPSWSPLSRPFVGEYINLINAYGHFSSNQQRRRKGSIGNRQPSCVAFIAANLNEGHRKSLKTERFWGSSSIIKSPEALSNGVVTSDLPNASAHIRHTILREIQPNWR